MPKSILITIIALAILSLGLTSLWKFGEREAVTDLKNEIIPEKVRPYETIEFGGAKIAVEIRDTSALRLQGLSDRPGLKSQEGMLFVFDKADYHGFWMKNMRFPIDIIWFDENRSAVEIVNSAPPEGARPKKIYTPREKALYALEINAGFVKERGIVRGDAFSFVRKDTPINDKPSATTPTPPLKDRVLIDVPFTAQAPFGEWSDPRQEDGCEEASIIMAMRWVNGRALTREEARAEILKISEFETERYGFFEDTSAEDTARLARDYYKHEASVEKDESVSVAAIKKHLSDGHLVIAPMDGQKIKNPYYTEPGPPRHMILVIGYDDKTGEFITNDPGTRRGAKYRYPYQRFLDSISDYPSGKKVAGGGGKAIIIIGK